MKNFKIKLNYVCIHEFNLIDIYISTHVQHTFIAWLGAHGRLATSLLLAFFFYPEFWSLRNNIELFQDSTDYLKLLQVSTGGSTQTAQHNITIQATWIIFFFLSNLHKLNRYSPGLQPVRYKKNEMDTLNSSFFR